MGRRTAIVLAVGVLGLVGHALGADQMIRGKRLLIRDGGTPTTRRVTGAARELASLNTIVGNPATTGATLDVVVDGARKSAQTFVLPPAGWTPLGTLGFKFSGTQVGGAVRKVVIKRTRKRVFLVRVSLNGRGGPLTIIPPDPGAEGGFVLHIGDGDTYCVMFGGPAGGVDKKDTATKWLMVKPSGEACPPSSTTTTTTTTTTSATSTTVSASSTTSLGTTSSTTTSTLAATTTTTTTAATSTTTSTTTTSTTTFTTTSLPVTTTTGTSSTTTSLTVPSSTTTSTTTTTTSTTTTTVPGCDCCSATRLSFTTGTPQIGVDPGCGSVSPGACVNGSNAGAACSDDSTCTGGGTCVGALDCGGLYFGGAGVSVLLPSIIPDMGQSITKIQNCSAGAGTFDLVATTDADTGSNRTCTAAGVTNPEYPRAGCLFGPPLPVPNANVSATSTCVVNRIVTSATGTGTCGGAASIDFDLNADLYLTGDLISGTAGIQPCPICNGGVCVGGPNNGLACTPGSSNLGAAYPTTHDCPPPEANFIGSLPIPFALTTGTVSRTATDTDGGGAQSHVFCGFCRSGIPPNPFRNPPQPCTSNADCTTAPFTTCQQRTDGAFGNGTAMTITETGTPAGCVADGLAHDATLVSVFCLPPSYNGLVDGAADIPGPGAVALVGKTQLSGMASTTTTTTVATTTTTTAPATTTTSSTLLGTTTTSSTVATTTTTSTLLPTTTTTTTTTTTATTTTSTTVTTTSTTSTTLPCGLLGLVCVGGCPAGKTCASSGPLTCTCQ